ncbi:MAG: hypothetical protein ACT4P5_12715 [Armatimonadota bacterium]
MDHVEGSRSHSRPADEPVRAALWIGVVTIGSVLGSLAFACAAPLAAMATIAGLKMRNGEGFALVGAAWLANQLVGYLILEYPRTWDSFAWGGAIGIASALAFVAAAAVATIHMRALVTILLAFGAAFLAYEGMLYAATAVLPSSDGAFSAEVVMRILEVNAVALVLLIAAHRAAVMLRLLKPLPICAPTTA